jgi:hypothetical protein
VMDDRHGPSKEVAQLGDGSVSTTAVAGGMRIGTAIVTATRTGPLGPDFGCLLAKAQVKRRFPAQRGECVAERPLRRQFGMD